MSFFRKDPTKKKFDGKKDLPAVAAKTEKAEPGIGKIGGLGLKAKELREAQKIIMHPLVTEKGAHLSGLGQYVFAVHASATKVQVRQAIHEMFGVYPRHVNIVNQMDKQVTRGRVKGFIRRPTKAYVTMPKGVTLDVYAGV